MDFYGMHGGGDSRGSYGEIGGPGGPGSYPITDKRNRNPNWTDGEIIRFLEILQEEDVLKDLMANRNKQVFCYVAQRLCAEGAPKTWDQCRIKLKNLKSQYRYIKERIPQIVQLDLEDDTVMKRLIHECQGRGISPSNLKHLRYLKRFLAMMSGAKSPNPLATSSEFLPQLPPLTRGIRIDSGSSSLGGVGVINENSNSQEARLSDPLDGITRIRGSKRSREDIEEAVSPPPMFLKLKVHNDPKDDATTANGDDNATGEPESKHRRRFGSPTINSALKVHSTLGANYIEKFNQDMMEQFMEHQRQVQANIQKWEMERQRQHEVTMERWRQQSRDHEKQMFGMFIKVMNECNNALTNMVKVGGKVAAASSSSSSSSNNHLLTRSSNGAATKEEQAEHENEDDYDDMILEPDVSIGEEEEDQDQIKVDADEQPSPSSTSEASSIKAKKPEQLLKQEVK